MTALDAAVGEGMHNAARTVRLISAQLEMGVEPETCADELITLSLVLDGIARDLGYAPLTGAVDGAPSALGGTARPSTRE